MDIETLLEPVSEDAPTGANLEYTDLFLEMEKAAAGKAEQQMGEAVIEAEQPDWGTVKQRALALLKDTKDLRVAMYLMRGATHVDGADGTRAGLQLLDGLIQRYWGVLHPLDADDADDPDMRLNALQWLGHAEGLPADLQHVQLVESRSAGRFTLRDVRAASGDLSVDDPPDPRLVAAAFMDCELDALQATAAAMTDSLAAVASIVERLGAAVGAERTPDFAGLIKLLEKTVRLLRERLAERGAAQVTAEPEQANPASNDPAGSVPAAVSAGEVASREDVVRLLDKACDYYRRYEPGSPVPLLLERAKRLISMDFMQIIQDLAPDGATQAAKVCGVQEKD